MFKKAVSILTIFLMINSFCYSQNDESSGGRQDHTGKTVQSREFVGREFAEREIAEREFFGREFAEREFIKREILYRFGEYIDGIYIVDLRDEEYINARIILESGEELDLARILGNYAIGAVVIAITAITMPMIAPTIAAKTVLAITVANSTAALADSAMSGIRTYIETGGDINQALVTASGSFRSTSIFLSVGTMTGLAMTYRVNPALRASRYRTLTEGATRVTHGLEANKTYRQYSAQYPYFTTTNSAAKIGTEYTPQLFLSGTPRRGDWTRRSDLLHMGYELLPGDIAGHLFGDRFGGSHLWDNIEAMAEAINKKNGKWYQMEELWASSILQNKAVTDVFIRTLRKTPAGRAFAFWVEFNIDGQHYIRYIANR